MNGTVREWSKSEREQMLYINVFRWSLGKMIQMNLSAKQKQETDVKNKCMDTSEKGAGWGELGEWDWHLDTTMHKRITIDNVLYSTGELYSTLCGDLNGRKPQRGYMYTYSSFTALCSRNQHNIIKQLYSNTIKKMTVGSTRRCSRESGEIMADEFIIIITHLLCVLSPMPFPSHKLIQPVSDYSHLRDK